MNSQKIIRLVIGIALACAGVYCIVSPGITIAVMAWVVGIFMVVMAVSRIGVWQERRALGFAENYELAGALLSLLFGAALIISNFFQILVSTFIIYILAAWIAMFGIFRLLVAANLRRLEADLSVGINNYRSQAITGALLVVIAIIVFLRPGIITAIIGIFIGVCLLVCGLQQVLSAVRG